jgi:EamA domain-containing membrane protein RarD
MMRDKQKKQTDVLQYRSVTSSYRVVFVLETLTHRKKGCDAKKKSKTFFSLFIFSVPNTSPLFPQHIG